MASLGGDAPFPSSTGFSDFHPQLVRYFSCFFPNFGLMVYCCEVFSMYVIKVHPNWTCCWFVCCLETLTNSHCACMVYFHHVYSMYGLTNFKVDLILQFYINIMNFFLLLLFDVLVGSRWIQLF